MTVGLVTGALVGCGSNSNAGSVTSPAGSRDDIQASLPPRVVRDETIRAQKAPETRTLLEWWQSVQFKDVESARLLTSPRTLAALGARRFAALVTQVGSGLGGVRVLGVRRFGSQASVRVLELAYTPTMSRPAPRQPTSSNPATFLMRSEKGKWRFADTAWLRQTAKALKP